MVWPLLLADIYKIWHWIEAKCLGKHVTGVVYNKSEEHVLCSSKAWHKTQDTHSSHWRLQCPHDAVIMYSCFVAIIFLHLHINIVCCSRDSGSMESVTLHCATHPPWFLCSWSYSNLSSTVITAVQNSNIIQKVFTSENQNQDSIPQFPQGKWKLMLLLSSHNIFFFVFLI